MSHDETMHRRLENDELVQKKTLPTDMKLKIKQARIAKKMTQKELAAMLNVKPDIINKIEGGSIFPDPKLLNKIKGALNV